MRALMVGERLERARVQAAHARASMARERWEASQAPAVRQKVGALNTERTLGWCPADRRAEYRRLLRSLRFTAGEARALIEADIPGTIEHGRREVANHKLAAQLRRERDLAQAY